MSQVTRVCLLGFGEVGQTLAAMLDAMLETLNANAEHQGTTS